MSRRDAATAETPAPILRSYPRFTPNELAGLRAARVRWRPELSVRALSVGGVRFEIPGELAANSTVVLEFLSRNKTVLRTARILRCQSIQAMASPARAGAGGGRGR